MSLSTKRRILIIDDQESIHQDYRKIITPLETEAGGLADVEAALFGNVAPSQEQCEASIEMILGDLLRWAGSSRQRQGGDKLANCV